MNCMSAFAGREVDDDREQPWGNGAPVAVDKIPATPGLLPQPAVQRLNTPVTLG
jgi:hypothetical protein